MTDPNLEGVRLQKVLAAAGLGSRRHCEALINDGLVEVNGRTITEQGRRVDPLTDVIRVDGARIPPPRRHVYLMFHKPRGVVSTMDDPQGRSTITDYLGKRVNEGLFHVGRLDTPTEARTISFSTDELGIMLTVTHAGRELSRLDGWLTWGGAQVQVTSADGSVHETTADADGRFVLDDLPQGQTRILVRKDGARPVVTPGFTI